MTRRAMRWTGTVLVAAAWIVTPAVSAAAQEMETDRPDFTEGTRTVAPGRVQVEMGATLDDTTAGEDLTVGETLLRLGVAPRVELRLGAGSYLRSEADDATVEGWGQPSVGVKMGLRPEARGAAPAAALLVGVGLPFGDDRVTLAGAEPSAVLALAWDLAPGWGLGANLGWARAVDGDGRRFEQGLASLAAGYDLGAGWGLFLETYGFTREAHGGDATTYADAGLTWSPRPDLQLDLRLGTAVEGPEDDFVGVGVSLRR